MTEGEVTETKATERTFDIIVVLPEDPEVDYRQAPILIDVTATDSTQAIKLAALYMQAVYGDDREFRYYSVKPLVMIDRVNLVDLLLAVARPSRK